MGFITDTFLLETETAKLFYEMYAAPQPIFDYHCHLSARDIAEDRRFANLFEIWLEGDHYKWRVMRANGVPERFCTGDAEPIQKFLAWARTVPATIGNVQYHWTHLELQRYFGIDYLLDETTALAAWQRANELLANQNLSAQGILKKFRVKVLCTTDDPTDSLNYHAKLQASLPETRVFPAFRPDKALRTHDPVAFNAWTDQLAASANIHVARLPDFLSALRKCHERFHQYGCRLSDHGLDYCFADACNQDEAENIFDRVRSGREVEPADSAKFASFMLFFFGCLDAERGWTKQLHLGAYRNANTRMLMSVGRDAGFDSIGDWRQVNSLQAYLDSLERAKMLPKLIVYNANPIDNYSFATMIGNFQDGTVPGKLQFGSAWWFLDQKQGIEWQLSALANCGLLSRFIGMVTDSRSFMSYPRHEYFRRLLCNLLGNEIEAGRLPGDEKLIGTMIRNICFNNAASYLQLPGAEAVSENSVVPAKVPNGG
jgi:glucuronate isomerase